MIKENIIIKFKTISFISGAIIDHERTYL